MFKDIVSEENKTVFWRIMRRVPFATLVLLLFVFGLVTSYWWALAITGLLVIPPLTLLLVQNPKLSPIRRRYNRLMFVYFGRNNLLWLWLCLFFLSTLALYMQTGNDSEPEVTSSIFFRAISPIYTPAPEKAPEEKKAELTAEEAAELEKAAARKKQLEADLDRCNEPIEVEIRGEKETRTRTEEQKYICKEETRANFISQIRFTPAKLAERNRTERERQANLNAGRGLVTHEESEKLESISESFRKRNIRGLIAGTLGILTFIYFGFAISDELKKGFDSVAGRRFSTPEELHSAPIFYNSMKRFLKSEAPTLVAAATSGGAAAVGSRAAGFWSEVAGEVLGNVFSTRYLRRSR
ncbi:MAG: hypothetical protein KW793_03995 [Candidatus Doudnabacteria bacterium]|nr:hypothetical protein [Candidatus Doudnabacteria bacterium]